jgi:tetratricopeptide (TPR) repeat protein
MNVHCELGLRLLEVQRYGLAEREFRAAVAEESTNSTPRALLAVCLLGLFRYDDAHREAEAAVGCDADDPFAVYTLSRAKSALGRHYDAIHTIERCLQLAPLHPDYLAFRAWLFLQINWFDGALAAASEALQQEPNHSHAIQVRVIALQSSARFDEAEHEVDRAIRLYPVAAWSHEIKGSLALRQGRSDQALVHYREALRSNPLSEGARVGFVEALKSRSPFYRRIMWLFPRTGKNLLLAWIGRGLLASTAIGALGGLVCGLFSPNAFLTVAETFILGGVFTSLSLYIFWLMVALSYGNAFFDFLLRFDPLGRTALTADERRSAVITVGLVVVAFGFGLAAVVLSTSSAAVTAALILFVGIPLALALFSRPTGSKEIQLILGLVFGFQAAVVPALWVHSSPDTPAVGVLAVTAGAGLLRYLVTRPRP